MTLSRALSAEEHLLKVVRFDKTVDELFGANEVVVEHSNWVDNLLDPESTPAYAVVGGRLPKLGLQARILRVGDRSPERQPAEPFLVRSVLHHRAAREET